MVKEVGAVLPRKRLNVAAATFLSTMRVVCYDASMADSMACPARADASSGRPLAIAARIEAAYGSCRGPLPSSWSHGPDTMSASPEPAALQVVRVDRA